MIESSLHIGIDMIDAHAIRQMIAERSYVLICDQRVKMLYPELVEGFTTISLPGGEECKSFEVYQRVIGECHARGLNRQSVIIAIGGGSIGDLAGFVAATYMRGIAVIHIATTLIAMCDSAIGGKNAINTQSGKNMVGTFHLPEAVYCDLRFLHTLPLEQVRSGFGELVKMGIAFDPEILSMLKALPAPETMSNGAFLNALYPIIERAASIKAEIVSRDLYDHGERMLLNFGHTLGHGIEYASGYRIPHGDAVAIGCYQMALMARREGRLSPGDMMRIDQVYTHLGLPRNIDGSIPRNQVFAVVMNDKKIEGNHLGLIVLDALGTVVKELRVPHDFFDQVLHNVVERTVIEVPTSKSYAHRYFVLAALATGRSVIRCVDMSDDLMATLRAIEKLGAHVEYREDGKTVLINGAGGKSTSFETGYMGNNPVIIDCAESGSTLRFMMPLFHRFASGVTFTGQGSLLDRPIRAYLDIFRSQGVSVRTADYKLPVTLRGRLLPGRFTLAGNVSSQYISGLLMTAPLLGSDCLIEIEGELESRPYVEMTIDAMRSFGVIVRETEQGFFVSSGQRYRAADVEVEADYSQAAFWTVAQALTGIEIQMPNLPVDSLQGDRRIMELIEELEAGATVDIRDNPDLFPILAVYLSFAGTGGTISGAMRNHLKESDRISAMAEELGKIGGSVREIAPGVVRVEPIRDVKAPSQANPIRSHGDHRIVMAMSIAALCAGLRGIDIGLIDGVSAVDKSYPNFFEHLQQVQVLAHQKYGIRFR